MIVNEKIEHVLFRDLPRFLKKNDVLVVNETRVLPAKIEAKKNTGGKVEILLVSKIDLCENSSGTSGICEDKNKEVIWECLAIGKNLKEGTTLVIDNKVENENKNMKAKIISRGERTKIAFECSETEFWNMLANVGKMPLPPYIRENLDDKEKYQTVYSRNTGSIAAPTAGLHFTPNLIEKISEIGVEFAKLTLHVGLGTFLPVKSEDIREHKMERERFVVTKECAEKINSARENGGRLIVVGTTSMRAVESSNWIDGKIYPSEGETGLFIYPGYKFKSNADALLTNFHLPKSTLLMLVSAYAGLERVMNAYKVAVEERYRFYSFGDAMLLFPNKS